MRKKATVNIKMEFVFAVGTSDVEILEQLESVPLPEAYKEDSFEVEKIELDDTEVDEKMTEEEEWTHPHGRDAIDDAIDGIY